MTVNECAAIWSALNEADSAGDAQALATIAWRLYGQLDLSSAKLAELASEMAALLANARATVADAASGAPDPLVHIRHLLSVRGWMPEAGSRSAQLLADYALRTG